MQQKIKEKKILSEYEIQAENKDNELRQKKQNEERIIQIEEIARKSRLK